VILTERQLNRTLLLRQHLLSRSSLTPTEMIEHLVGLQAQESMPPFFALAARLASFDPTRSAHSSSRARWSGSPRCGRRSTCTPPPMPR
jgi:hypothetical protein